MIPRTQQVATQNKFILYLASTYERDKYKFAKFYHHTEFTSKIAAIKSLIPERNPFLAKLERDLNQKDKDLLPETRFTNEANVNEYLALILTTAK